MPRKPSTAATRMVKPSPIVARTIIGDSDVGQDVQEARCAACRRRRPAAHRRTATAEPPRLGIDDAGEERPVGQRQRQHRAFDRRRHELRERERQHELRDRQHHVGDPHDRLRQPAAAIAGDAGRAARRSASPADDGERHLQRAARAEDDAGEDVAAEIVGAERIGGAGRLQPAQQMGRAGIFRVGRDPGAEERQRPARPAPCRAPITAGHVARQLAEDRLTACSRSRGSSRPCTTSIRMLTTA